MIRKKILKWIPYLFIAFVLLQTLFFKFTGHPESVTLFSQIDIFNIGEQYGRITIGILELLVSLGLFMKRTRLISLIGVAGLMAGAAFFHFAFIGFEGVNLQLFLSGFASLIIALILIGKHYAKK